MRKFEDGSLGINGEERLIGGATSGFIAGGGFLDQLCVKETSTSD